MMTIPNSIFGFLFITTMVVGIVITLAVILNGTEALAQNDTLRVAKGQRNGSIEENTALVESAIKEIFNQRNVSAADKYIAEDLINHNPNAGQGREPLKQYFDKVYFTAFPDSQTTIEQMLGEGDLVLVFLNWTGTHDGEFFGKQPTSQYENCSYFQDRR